MPSGTVKFVNAERGFGFISRDDKEPKVFVHVSEAQKAGLDTLEKGQRWIFAVKTGDDGRITATDLIFDGYR
jgi:CspA family cold shock protein